MRVCTNRFYKALEQNVVAAKEAVAILEISGICIEDLQKVKAILKADEDNRLSRQQTGECDQQSYISIFE